MKKTIVFATALVSGVLMMSGCNSNSGTAVPTTTGQAPVSQAPTTTEQLAPAFLPSYPVGPINGTLKVWLSSTDFVEVTVSNYQESQGHVWINATVKAHGSASLFFEPFSAMTATGEKVRAVIQGLDWDKNPIVVKGIDLDTKMVDGEVRTGFVEFPVQSANKIFLGSSPAAQWNVN